MGEEGHRRPGQDRERGGRLTAAGGGAPVGAGALRASEKDGALTVDVVVQPRAARDALGPVQGDRLRVAVTAPPVDGKANEAVVRTFSEALKLPRSAVEIVRGETGRRKTVRLRGVTLAGLLAAIS